MSMERRIIELKFSFDEELTQSDIDAIDGVRELPDIIQKSIDDNDVDISINYRFMERKGDVFRFEGMLSDENVTFLTDASKIICDIIVEDLSAKVTYSIAVSEPETDGLVMMDLGVLDEFRKSSPSNDSAPVLDDTEDLDEDSYLLKLVFDGDWILEHRNDTVLPIDEIIDILQEEYISEIKNKSLSSCEIIIYTSLIDDAVSIREFIDNELKEMGAKVVSLSIEEYNKSRWDDSKPPIYGDHESEGYIDDDYEYNEEAVYLQGAYDEDDQEDEEDEEEMDYTVNKTNSLKKINELIGSSGYKELASELVSIAPQVEKHKTLRVLMDRTYLFSIGDGCGFTTQINYLKGLLRELFDESFDVKEYPADKKLSEIADDIEDTWSSGRIFCFDLSHWMDKTHDVEFRSFVKRITKFDERFIIVFRIPFVDVETRRKINAALSDYLTVREVITAPFTMEELVVYAKSLFSTHGFVIEENGSLRLEERIIAEKSDGGFYGMCTIQKIVNEVLYQKHLSVARGESNDDKTIRSEDIPEATGDTADNRPAKQQLEELIGMEEIKTRLDELIAQIEVARNVKDGLIQPTLHMRFLGNPGTGKTTVARILGKLMRERGLLTKGKFFEYAGRDFVGIYIGETAPKTAAMCRDAYGSVLFIDEAYSLYRGGDDKDFGKEAIDTLIAQMENHRHDLMVIMAGYSDDMDNMMKANLGLASRIPYTLDFPNFKREELFAIYMQMVKRSFEHEPELEEAVKAYFDALSDEVLESKDFANARFVRNLFERTWSKASTRKQLDSDKSFVLRACDFDKAAADREFSFLQQKKKKRIGF